MLYAKAYSLSSSDDQLSLSPNPSTEQKPTIVLVEDDSDLSTLLRRELEREHFKLLLARDRDEAHWVLRRVSARKIPLLTIIDLNLAQGNGSEIISFIRNLREIKRSPILAISSRSAPEVRIRALEEGADDILEKPFGMREFLSRIRVLSRCYEQSTSPLMPDVTVTLGPLYIDTQKIEVAIEGQEVLLTRLEFRILHYLALHQGRVVTKEELLSSLWGEEEPVADETLKVHISAIRKKLGDRNRTPKLIETLRGFGYRLKKSLPPR